VADRRRDTFDVLDVQGGKHIDFCVEKLLNIFVALTVSAAWNVGVSEFVNESDGWLPGQDGVHVHLFEDGAFVFDFAPGNGLKLRTQFFNSFAAVGFDDPDDNVFAARVPANRFTEHAKGLANAGRVAEKKLEAAPRFLGGGNNLEPILRLLRQSALQESGADERNPRPFCDKIDL